MLRTMIFAIVLVAVGIVTRQRLNYWFGVGAALLVQNTVGYLFNGDTGLATPWFREVTGDGPLMAVYGLGVILLAWVLPVGLVAYGFERRRKPAAAE